MASMGLPARAGVHVAGGDVGELTGWSAPLGAAVVVVPDQAPLLSALLDDPDAGGGGQGLLVRVVGGSGGVGTSTFAAALAQAGAGRGWASALVEHDPQGGGLDVLFGAEGAQGWRWDDLRAASGHIEVLAGRLPNVSGVDIVANARPSAAEFGRRPSDEAVRAVVSGLLRSHRLVVMDCGRGELDVGGQWRRTATLVVAGADVRGVLAAWRLVGDRALADASLVVRRGRGRSIDAESVATTIGLPVLGVLPDDRRLPTGGEVGEPPGRRRGRYRTQVERILDQVTA